jgi:micrococcal nuclease
MSELKVNEYDVILLKAVDGDTVDVDIDLGFGIWLRDERVRIMGIDTPESRTSDKVEKVFGLAAKTRLKELLENGAVLVTTEDKSGEDMKGKFGRILGDFKTPDGKLVTDVLVEEILSNE